MQAHGWCHNGYHNLPADEVLRRARLARIDALIIKYGDPTFERAVTDAGFAWGTERFAYAGQAAREGNRLADAVDAGARFAVANCEPNDGGGWNGDQAVRAIRTLIDTFRQRHPRVPLYVCADLRRGRSLDAPFVREAARGGTDGWLPMVYPGAFQQGVQEAFDAAYPGATYLGLPCEPVLQTHGAIGEAAVREQVREAHERGARGCSIYVVETASGAELRAVAERPAAPLTPDLLRELALAYRTGSLRLLLEGTPAELAGWARRWCPPPQPTEETGDGPVPADVRCRLDYVRGAIALLDHGEPRQLESWAAYFSRKK